VQAIKKRMDCYQSVVNRKDNTILSIEEFVLLDMD
jgi:hypothetical protein